MEFEDPEEEHEEGEAGLPSPNYSVLAVTSNSTGRPAKMPNPPETSPSRKPRYKECLKNHAVGIGGHSVDGCREFMAAGAEGTMDALICAACNCHRNFHRKEVDSGGCGDFLHHQHRLLVTHHPPGHFSYRSPTGYLHHVQQQHPIPAAGGSGAREELEEYYSNPSSSSGKKRFRTKFTAEQKEKMLKLAERIGWRMQKEDEELVQQVCNEAGVKRQVFKVWMHNNKQTLGKKTTENPTA